jgi:hypothetical protein
VARVVYELSFKGSASDSIRSVFADFEVVPGHGCTTLRGALVDQAALHGAIARIQDLGLELLDVRLVAEANESDRAVWLPSDDETT